MNNEQRLTPENELICEKLLGWIKIRPTSPVPGIDFLGWRRPTGGEQLRAALEPDIQVTALGAGTETGESR